MPHEASVKYLARDLGTKGMRVNAISAGPIKTLAASAIGDAKFLYKWNEDHSFLKRNVDIHGYLHFSLEKNGLHSIYIGILHLQLQMQPMS